MMDVCLLLEGTYPYVAGGVATWVHQLIDSMKDIRFGVLHVAAHSDPTRTLKYKLPQNVVYLGDVYLHDYALQKNAHRRPKLKDAETLKQFFEGAVEKDFSKFKDIVPLFQGSKSCFDFNSFFMSKPIWDALVTNYDRFASDQSFLDFFWTWRGTHLPLVQIMMSDLPRAKIYHAVSTGYAGLLGALAKLKYDKKFYLTEHGIYTHERMLEIAQSTWIYERERAGYRAQSDLSLFKKWWMSIFAGMSSIAYMNADQIFTLYEGNRIREILDGADSKKISIIPNGIDVELLGSIPRERRKTPHIGFVGRVVNIKDPKVFIQAAHLVLEKIPDASFYILGPTDEEEDYVDECKMLIEALHLEEHVKMMGRVDVKEYYKFLDLVVLTSISEAQPYVILEGGIAGIPMVSSDVGACREMLEGCGVEDAAIGPSGLITDVANPRSTADAIIQLLTNDVLYERCSEAARIRVKRYYNQNDLLSRYLNLYEQGM